MVEDPSAPRADARLRPSTSRDASANSKVRGLPNFAVLRLFKTVCQSLVFGTPLGANPTGIGGTPA